MTRHSPYVDYGRQAERYQQGRSLSAEAMERWGAAVRPHLPSTPNSPLRVLDLGAGTGIFVRAWPLWAPSSVVGLEPVPAMIREGRAGGPYVRGVAEHLPFRDDGLDVVWASTTLHHFADIRRAVAELGRVLQPKGRVLVRTYLPERTEITWHGVFPAEVRAKSAQRFFGVDWLTATFAPHGFTVSHVEDVTEETGTAADAADWIERMRHADSMLTALTDEDVAAGLDTLRSEPTKPVQVQLSLVVLARA